MPFTPVNYASDFMQGFQGMNDVLRQRRLDEDNRAQREKENARADTSLQIARDTNAREQTKFDRDIKTDDEMKRILGEVENPPAWIPKTIDDAPTIEQGHQAMLNYAGVLKKAPAGKFLVTRGQSPEIDTAIDTMQGMMGDVIGKTFTDKDGKTYTTQNLGRLAVESDGKGNVRMLPELTAVYEDGSTKLVPRTIDDTNRDDAQMKFTTPDELADKSSFALHTIAAARNSGRSPVDEYKDNLLKLAYAALGKAGVEKRYESDIRKGEAVFAKGLDLDTEKEKRAQIREEADAQTERVKAEVTAVEPAIKGVADNKSLTPEQKRAALLPILAGLSPEAAKTIQTTHSTMKELFPDPAKNEWGTVETSGGVYAWNKDTGKRGDRIGGLKPTAEGKGSGDGTTAPIKNLREVKTLLAKGDRAGAKNLLVQANVIPRFADWVDKEVRTTQAAEKDSYGKKTPLDTIRTNARTSYDNYVKDVLAEYGASNGDGSEPTPNQTSRPPLSSFDTASAQRPKYTTPMQAGILLPNM